MPTVTKPIALDESLHTTDGNNTNIADILLRLVNATGGCGYEIELPTTGYTSGTFTIWGESFTGYSITISSDHNGNPLTNFTSGMTADYPVNISGSNTNFSKLYAFEIGNGSVTVYMTSVPSSAFDVMIKEAI